jgi:hypothetical protein
MDKSYDCLNNLKCFKCSHSGLCAQNLGGADLIIAAATCEHFSAGTMLPENFWILYNPATGPVLRKYSVDKALFDHGSLSRLWGSSDTEKVTAYAADFGRTVFFSEAAGQLALKTLYNETSNSVQSCQYWQPDTFEGRAYCAATREHSWCSCEGLRKNCTYYENVRKEAVDAKE